MISTDVSQMSSKDLKTEDEIISRWSRNLGNPLVSISCISFNHEPYIEDAIIGFLRQETDFPFEILIHDDASTDRTQDIIERYQSLYPRIINAICRTENQYSKGAVPSYFNLDRAKGKYIAVCEGDDYWISSQHLSNAVQVLESKEGYSIYGASGIIKKGDSLKVCTLDKTRYDLKAYILDSPFVATASLVVRTAIWREIAELPVSGQRYFAGDTRLKLISLTKGDMFLSGVPEVVYRKGVSGSWSARKVDGKVILRELLDNLAITREVAFLVNYEECAALFSRIEDEVIRKGAKLAGLEGLASFLKFLFLNPKSFSLRNFRPVMSGAPFIRWLLSVVSRKA